MRGGYLSTFIDQNRKPLAGIRIDVPPYLSGVFKLLNAFGFHLRRLHGSETKKYIKFDEANLSLYLDVRLPDSDEWLQITPSQARMLKEQRDTNTLSRLSLSLEGSGSTNSGSESRSSTSGNSLRSFPIRLNPNFIPLGNTTNGRRDESAPQPRWNPPPRTER